MLHFEQSNVIQAPAKRVWEFYERPDILNLLTPPWQPVEIIRREGGLDIGAESEFRLWLGPLPIPWIAVHTACVKYQKFVDVQKQGPLEFWQHQHIFLDEGEQTTLIDQISFSLPGGEIAEMLLGDFIKQRLRDMFEYRHRVTQERCE
ncbi:MAG: SRPBCC family protein [Cyanobacteria bacterium P01_F01_bin.42]